MEDPLSVEEGKKVKFTIRLSRAYDVPVRVHYRTVNRSAFGSQAMDTGDFSATDRNSSIVFLPGQTDKTVTVRTNDDDVAETPEKFGLEVRSVASPRPIGWAKRVGLATILDNDGEPGPQVIVDDAEPVEEGNAVQFKIRLTAPSDKPVRVKYRTGDGSAIGTQVVGEGDYLSTDRSNTLVFRPGEMEKTVVVATNDDAIVEDREQFSLQVHRVSSKRAVGIEDSSGIGTILDNDGENRQAPSDAGPQNEPGEPVKDIDWGDINGNLDDIIWSCGTVDDMLDQVVVQIIASMMQEQPLNATQILAGGSPNVSWGGSGGVDCLMDCRTNKSSKNIAIMRRLYKTTCRVQRPKLNLGWSDSRVKRSIVGSTLIATMPNLVTESVRRTIPQTMPTNLRRTR